MATETINDIRVKPQAPIVSFDITPHGPVVSAATAFDSYSWDEVEVNSEIVVPAVYGHLTNTLLTFTGDVFDPHGATVLEWLWTFGDGVTADTQIATHTFRYPNPSLNVHLRVTMEDYRVGYASMNPMLIGDIGGIGYSFLTLGFFYATYDLLDADYATYDDLTAG